MNSRTRLIFAPAHVLASCLVTLVCGLPIAAQASFDADIATTATFGTPSIFPDYFSGVGTSTLNWTGPAWVDESGEAHPPFTATVNGAASGGVTTFVVDQPVVIGAVYAGGSISTPPSGDEYLGSAALPIEFQIDVTAPTSSSGSFTVTMNYDQLLNATGHWAADHMTIPEAGATVYEVEINGQIYDLELVGYSEDGGQTIVSNWYTTEDISGQFYGVFRLVGQAVTPIIPDTPTTDTSTQDAIIQAMDSIATTPNTASTATVIAVACPVSGSQFSHDCNILVNAAFAPSGSILNAEAAAALSAVTPNQAVAPLSSSRNSLSAQLRNISTRLAALRSGVRGISLQGFTRGAGLPDSFGDDFAGLINGLANTTGGAASADSPSDSMIALGDGRLGVFMNGSVSRGDKNATANEDGFDFNGWGLTAGVDYRLTEAAILGVAIGYNRDNTDIDQNGGSLDSNGYSVSLYGTFYPDEHLYADALVTYGRNSYDQDRNIRYRIGGIAVNQVASASYDSRQWSATLGAGYAIPTGPWTFTPVVQLQYSNADVDGYAEQMSSPSAAGGGWATRIRGVDQDSLTSSLGFDITRAISTAWGVLSPQFHLDWVHEYKDDAMAINGSFVNDPQSNVFGLQSDKPDSDYYNMRLAVSAQLARGNSMFLYYNKVLAYKNLDVDSVGVGVRLAF